MKTMKVYPSPKLGENEYVKGVGADGAEMPVEQAEAMLEAGLVVRSKAAARKAPSKPRVKKAKPKPAEPASEPEDND